MYKMQVTRAAKTNILDYPVNLDTDVSLLSVDLNVRSDDTKGTSDYTQYILRGKPTRKTLE